MTASPDKPSPLAQAKEIVQELVDGGPPALKSRLNALLALLGEAEQTMKPATNLSADAETLRAEIEAMKTRSAELNSVMVHEIRKPMTSIRGYADMLCKPGMIGPLNAMQQQFADTIRSNIMAMEGLVTNLSDFNKLTAERLKLGAKMTIFSQVMLDVQKQTDALAAQYEHTATYTVPQGLPMLMVDSPQLVKVMMHFVRNACMYTPKGGAVSITATPLDEAEGGPNKGFRVSITDSGIGIKPDDLGKLGQPFFRADQELVTSQKGYGLSLAVATGMLKLMGLKLDVQSTLETGSTFSFVLPAITPEQMAGA
jgi:signal transduction histidine kinase